ncbi:MAG: sodium:calcium antiporter [Armatimonadota bacterium]
MMSPLLWFVGMSVVVVAAGTLLAYAADALAAKTGLGRLAVGIILLAAATTLPEIVVDISAVRLGAPDLAVGDIMGSCTMNMLILAVMDLLHHHRHQVTMMPGFIIGQARIGTLAIVLAGIAGAALLAREPFALGTLGIGPLLIAVIYIMEMYAGARRQDPAIIEDEIITGPIKSLRGGIIGFAIGALAIGLAGPKLASTAGDLSALTGLGQTFFGSIFLALVTSLPELAASLAAIKMRAPELVIGNLFGSNAFNMAALLIFDAADHGGSLLAHADPRHALTAFITIVLMGLALQIMMIRQLRRTWFFEPAAAVLLMASLFGVLLMYLAR